MKRLKMFRVVWAIQSDGIFRAIALSVMALDCIGSNLLQRDDGAAEIPTFGRLPNPCTMQGIKPCGTTQAIERKWDVASQIPRQ